MGYSTNLQAVVTSRIRAAIAMRASSADNSVRPATKPSPLRTTSGPDDANGSGDPSFRTVHRFAALGAGANTISFNVDASHAASLVWYFRFGSARDPANSLRVLQVMHADGATAGTGLIDEGKTRRLVFVQLLAP